MIFPHRSKINSLIPKHVYHTPTSMHRTRIAGYDFARGLSLLGMVLVNYKYMMEADENGPNWLIWLSSLLEGRSAALFVVLLGVGLSLFKKSRKILFIRALFLFSIGLLVLRIWTADILHFDAVYIVFGVSLLTVSNRTLWVLNTAVVAFFILLIWYYYWIEEWMINDAFEFTLSKPLEIISNVLFNGFYSLFPWVVFVLLGMWLGRLDLSQSILRRKLAIISALSIWTAEWSAWFFTSIFQSNSAGIENEMFVDLFKIAPFPPTLFFLVSSSGSALLTIIMSIILTEKWVRPKWTWPILTAGRMTLTFYVAHLLIAYLFLMLSGRMETENTLEFASISAVVFCGVALSFSACWLRYFAHGPLEFLMRWISK